MPKPEEYGVSVRLVQEGGAEVYEARVAELPDIRTYGETHSEAYSGAIEVIKTAQQVFAAKGRKFPEIELIEDEFSGRVTLRMSKSLHRKSHERATYEGISLNLWLVEAIASRADGKTVSTESVFVLSPMFYPRGNVAVKVVPAKHFQSLIWPEVGVVNLFTTPGLSEAKKLTTISSGTPTSQSSLTNG